MTGTSQRGDGSTDLTLRLVLRPGEPLTGILRVGDDGRESEFCGWLELMAAIDSAREAPRRPDGPC
ncbi:MAG TPA: hypothetical protein VFR49_02240 [Solirubrobacteraceae bacterium]|nr:hypothetical protein [Solirubrobacteraceae bacterium]